MRTVAVAATCAALSLIAAGCGDEADPGSGDSGWSAYGEKGNGDATWIDMSDNRFEPAKLRVKVGDSVKFENVGQLAHTATAVGGAKLDSGTVEAGESYEWKAASPGDVPYVCDFHPGMTGVITVE